MLFKSLRSVGLRKCLYDHCLANKAYFSAIAPVKNIYESFTHKMATKAAGIEITSLSRYVLQGIILPGFIMACELFASKHRTFAGIIIEDFWGVATCVLALLAFLIRDWVYLQLLISLIGVLTVPLFWYN